MDSEDSQLQNRGLFPTDLYGLRRDSTVDVHITLQLAQHPQLIQV